MAEWSEKNIGRDEENEESDKIPVGEFIEKNYSKFALIGIFVSVAIFLQSTQHSLVPADRRVATAGALLIYLVASGWIVFHSYNQLTNYESIVPGLNEIAYSIIAVGNLMLFLVIASQLTGIGRETQLVMEIVLVTILVNVFANIEPVLPHEEGNIGEGFTVALTVGGAMSFTQAFSPTSEWYMVRAVEPILGIESVYLVNFFAAFIIAGLIIHMGIYGVISITIPEIMAGEKLEIRNMWERIRGSWRVRTSIFFVLLLLSVITISAKYTAEAAIGPNPGYYELFGDPWKRLIFLYWLGNCAIGSSLIVLDNQKRGIRRTEGIGKLWVIANLALSLVIAYGIATGRHVIPL